MTVKCILGIVCLSILLPAGVAVITISALVIREIIDQKSNTRNLEQSHHEAEIYLTLSFVTILVGFVQSVIAIRFCFANPKSLNRVLPIWIGTHVLLSWIICVCLILGLGYQLIESYELNGDLEVVYLPSFLSYGIGAAYVAVLIMDLFVFLGLVILTSRVVYVPSYCDLKLTEKESTLAC